MSRNKGTTGQAHSLAMRRDEPGQSVNIQDGMRDNQYFSAKFCFRTPFLTLERAFPVFERPFLFSNVLSCARMSFWEIDFVLGRPGTDEFVPGFLLLPLSRDTGRRQFICPDLSCRTSLPVETLIETGSIYRIVASRSTSRLVTCLGLFRLLMKGIFGPYVL